MRLLGQWLYNLLVALDQLGNTLMGGDPDETISSRAHKAHQAGARWGTMLCRGLNVIQHGHCELSREDDEGKNALTP